jgi:GNAT superfamily N-acetyltransferase
MRQAFRIAVAGAADAAAIKPVIERAYRGEAARGGWTHEADLMAGERIPMPELLALTAAEDTRLMVAWQGDVPVGSVTITNKGDGTAYLGLLSVDPDLQAGGLGRQLIAAAEAEARAAFGALTMEMTVIDRRPELIAWYERRGYARSGELRPLIVAGNPEMTMVVLTRAIG